MHSIGADELADLPATPGVYLFVDRRGCLTVIRRRKVEALWQGRLSADTVNGADASELRLVMYVFVFVGGLVVTFCGSLFSLIVMGGATRNLVAHLVWNEPVTARTTYRAVKERFWGLLGASILVALWLGFAAIIAAMGYGFLSFIMVMAVAVGASTAIGSIST